MALSDTPWAVGARRLFIFCLRVSLTLRCNSASAVPPAETSAPIRLATPSLTIPHSTRRSPYQTVHFDHSKDQTTHRRKRSEFLRKTSARVTTAELSVGIQPFLRPH